MLDTVAVISANKSHDVRESTVKTQSTWSYVRRFLDWFCGLDSSTASSTPKQMHRSRDMTSLHQTHRARAALYTALTVLITLDLFLYVFFSSGSDFGLLRNSPPAVEFLFSNVTTAHHSTILLNHTVGT